MVVPGLVVSLLLAVGLGAAVLIRPRALAIGELRLPTRQAAVVAQSGTRGRKKGARSNVGSVGGSSQRNGWSQYRALLGAGLLTQVARLLPNPDPIARYNHLYLLSILL